MIGRIARVGTIALAAALLIGLACGRAEAAVELAAPLIAQQPQGGAASPLGQLFWPMTVVMLMAYFLLIRPQQTKQRRYDEMITSLKENDRVVTTGGLHGVVTSVQRDANRVTLRLDDATGAKVKVALWAISHLAADEKPAEGGAEKKNATDKSSSDKNAKAAGEGKNAGKAKAK